MTSRRQPRIRDERGAMVAMTAIAVVSLLSVASITLDLGEVWASRRHLVTGADAAAVEKAIFHAVGRGDGSCDLVGTNSAGAVVETCERIVTGPTSGYTTVVAEREVDHLLARLVGIDSSTIVASASAFYGQPSSVTGLRPFGLCTAATPLAGWIAAGPPWPTAVLRIPYTKDHPDDCSPVSSVPGNWGVLDFDGGGGGQQEIVDWVLNGYPGRVSVGDLIGPKTGAISGSVQNALDEILGTVFTLPIFDSASGNGNNARFEIAGFVQVRLIDYRVTGSQAGRYLELELMPGIATGTCCDPSSIDTGVRVVGICHVDHAVTDRDAACRR